MSSKITNSNQIDTQEATETMDKFNNLTIDDSVFTATDGSKKKKKGKKPKDSNKKGTDFMEYAKKNEISVDIKYEKSPEKTEQKEYKNNYPQKQQYNNKENYHQNNNTQYNQENQGNQGRYYNKDNRGGHKSYNNNYSNNNNVKKYHNNNNTNKFHQKKNFYNNNNNNAHSTNQHYGQSKTFNNKFDPMNMYNVHPYMLNPPQFSGMRPDMMYFGQMPIQPYNTQLNHEKDDHAEKGIKESLEYYLSLDNLNKDYYIRTKIDADGYIDVNDILNFNNMKKHQATLDSIREIIKEENSIIEEATFNDKVYLRNKNFNDFKKNLCSLEELEAKKTKKGNYNYNFVTMQNNYYMPMMPYDQNMMMQHGNQMMGMPHMMGMNQHYGQNHQLDNQ